MLFTVRGLYSQSRNTGTTSRKQKGWPQTVLSPLRKQKKKLYLAPYSTTTPKPRQAPLEGKELPLRLVPKGALLGRPVELVTYCCLHCHTCGNATPSELAWPSVSSNRIAPASHSPIRGWASRTSRYRRRVSASFVRPAFSKRLPICVYIFKGGTRVIKEWHTRERERGGVRACMFSRCFS